MPTIEDWICVPSRDWFDSIEVDQSIPDVKLTSGGMEGWEIGEYKPDILKRAKESAGSWTKII